MESSDLQMLFNLYSTECSKKTRYLMSKLINFLFLCVGSLWVIGLHPAALKHAKGLFG